MASIPILVLVALPMLAADRLDTYNIAEGSITVSGVSSGAAFATQIHVAHSSLIRAVGLSAGVTYYCGEASVPQSLDCAAGEGPSGEYLAGQARQFELEDKIDSTAYLADSNSVFILHGALDEAVAISNVDDIAEFYKEFLSEDKISEVTDLPLVHGWPTEDFGTLCNTTNTDIYINYCNYHGAYEMLDTLYGGGLQRPTSSTPTPGDWYEFDQTEFVIDSSMDALGFAYIPTQCINKETACSLHVHFHGCTVGRAFVGDEYVLNTFINHVGEINDIIILYPQVENSVALPTNPLGCWDWWGYNDVGVTNRGNYATRLGDQIKGIHGMLMRVTGMEQRSA